LVSGDEHIIILFQLVQELDKTRPLRVSGAAGHVSETVVLLEFQHQVDKNGVNGSTAAEKGATTLAPVGTRR
jgi:hypothetical protein